MDTLAELIDQADGLARDDRAWLLRASELAEAVHGAVLSDPQVTEAVRQAVKAVADEVGCDIVIGASAPADSVVRGLAAQVANPSRALLFDFVRVTGATFTQATAELRHLDVVPAVLVDLRPSATADAPRLVRLRELVRS